MVRKILPKKGNQTKRGATACGHLLRLVAFYDGEARIVKRITECGATTVPRYSSRGTTRV
jgi:hypothetical protein